MQFDRLSPAALAPWLAAAYALHLLDERWVGEGVAKWATRVAAMPFSNDEWLAVNLVSLFIVLLLARAIHAKHLGAFALLVLAGHVFMHATQHLAGSFRFGEMSPGISTGLLLCLPASLLAVAAGFRRLPLPRAVTAFALGLATFQPIWHIAILSLFGSGHG